MSGRATIADIKALLQQRVRALVTELVPDGHFAGHTYSAKNPRRADKTRGSFVVWCAGSAPGCWKDFATDDKGDIVDLIAFCLGLETKDALKWAEDWLGLSRVSDDALLRARADAKRNAAKAEDEAATALAKQRRQAFAWWLKCHPRLNGTLAEDYLAARGIRLSALAHQPGALRFMQALEHKPSGTQWPAIVAAMTDAAGAVAAVHRTYLERDGSGKAPVTPNRMMWPASRGCVIRLSPGDSKLTPEEASRRGVKEPLCLTEGIEDGLSVALACPQLRVWAAGSLSNLAAITLPVCAAEVIVCADNDWGKRQALKLLQTGLDALAWQGVPVKVARSMVGKDVNDCLLHGAGDSPSVRRPPALERSIWSGRRGL